MGMKTVLLQWHQQDPPDAWELHRNDVVASFQGNRNPFIDHPEWVNCLFSGSCSITIACCTSSATTHGCVPTIAATGTPSVAANSGFVVATDDLEGQRTGLLLRRQPTEGPSGPSAARVSCA